MVFKREIIIRFSFVFRMLCRCLVPISEPTYWYWCLTQDTYFLSSSWGHKYFLKIVKIFFNVHTGQVYVALYNNFMNCPIMMISKFFYQVCVPRLCFMKCSYFCQLVENSFHLTSMRHHIKSLHGIWEISQWKFRIFTFTSWKNNLRRRTVTVIDPPKGRKYAYTTPPPPRARCYTWLCDDNTSFQCCYPGTSRDNKLYYHLLEITISKNNIKLQE